MRTTRPLVASTVALTILGALFGAGAQSTDPARPTPSTPPSEVSPSPANPPTTPGGTTTSPSTTSPSTGTTMDRDRTSPSMADKPAMRADRN